MHAIHGADGGEKENSANGRKLLGKKLFAFLFFSPCCHRIASPVCGCHRGRAEVCVMSMVTTSKRHNSKLLFSPSLTLAWTLFSWTYVHKPNSSGFLLVYGHGLGAGAVCSSACWVSNSLAGLLPAGGLKSACPFSLTVYTPALTSATNCKLHNPWHPSPGI